MHLVTRGLLLDGYYCQQSQGKGGYSDGSPGKTSVSLVSEPVTEEALEDVREPGIGLLRPV